MLEAARRLRSPLRAVTFETLIGLMAVTGLRTGEAMNLDCGDVDPGEQMLIVRCSKFGNYAEAVVMPSRVTVGVAGGSATQDSSALITST